MWHKKVCIRLSHFFFYLCGVSPLLWMFWFSGEHFSHWLCFLIWWMMEYLKSLHQEEIKANICGIKDRGINSLTRKLVVWVPLNVRSIHVPDRWSGTRLMGMFNTWARYQFRQACPWKESGLHAKCLNVTVCLSMCVKIENTPVFLYLIKINYRITE